MDSFNYIDSINNKYSIVLSRKYPSDSNLNYSHINPIFKKDDSSFTKNFNYDDKEHHCNEGSVEVISYKQFKKLLKSE